MVRFCYESLNIDYISLTPIYFFIFSPIQFIITISPQVDVNSALGYSKLLLYANNPPVNGTCELTYDQDKVYVLETLVR